MSCESVCISLIGFAVKERRGSINYEGKATSVRGTGAGTAAWWLAVGNCLRDGASDRIRTGDIQDHNLAL